MFFTEQIGLRPMRETARKKKVPLWKVRMENNIRKKCSDLSMLVELENGSRIKERKRKQMLKRYNIKNPADLTTVKEVLKQQIQAKAQRIRRFETRAKFFRQNKIFKQDTKKFYRELGKKRIKVIEPPALDEVEEFWANIWENDKTHNETAESIKRLEDTHTDLESQPWVAINVQEVTSATNKTNNWKSPGKDKVPNIWLKYLESLHEDMAKAYTRIIEKPAEMPEWLTDGLTILLSKTEETKNPKNYRPITCLPTMYKVLASILADRTYSFLSNHQLLPSEQKGCRGESYGCKDQLLVNKMILEACRTRKKNLSTAWIDYKKAFDSVPHSWIIKCMEIYKICPVVTQFITAAMRTWKSTLVLSHPGGSLTSRPINIKSGIFQGDSLSPLLFCMALAPLSPLLQESG